MVLVVADILATFRFFSVFVGPGLILLLRCVRRSCEYFLRALLLLALTRGSRTFFCCLLAAELVGVDVDSSLAFGACVGPMTMIVVVGVGVVVAFLCVSLIFRVKLATTNSRKDCAASSMNFFAFGLYTIHVPCCSCCCVCAKLFYFFATVAVVVVAVVTQSSIDSRIFCVCFFSSLFFVFRLFFFLFVYICILIVGPTASK